MLLDWKGFPLAGTSVTQPIHCRALLATKELKISLSFAQSLSVSDSTACPARPQSQQTQLQPAGEWTARCTCRLQTSAHLQSCPEIIPLCIKNPACSDSDHQLPASARSQPSSNKAVYGSYCIFPRTQIPLYCNHPHGKKEDGLSPLCQSFGFPGPPHAPVLAAAAGSGPGDRLCL